MKKVLFIVSVLIVGLTNCNKLDGCKVNTACTEEFRTINVKVTSSSYHPLLDSYSTTRISDGEIVNDNGGLIWESPTILSDNHINETTLEGETFLFEGYQDGQKVISEEYVIKHDCCHIIKVSGKSTINL